MTVSEAKKPAAFVYFCSVRCLSISWWGMTGMHSGQEHRWRCKSWESADGRKFVRVDETTMCKPDFKSASPKKPTCILQASFTAIRCWPQTQAFGGSSKAKKQKTKTQVCYLANQKLTHVLLNSHSTLQVAKDTDRLSASDRLKHTHYLAPDTFTDILKNSTVIYPNRTWHSDSMAQQLTSTTHAVLYDT